MKKNITWVNYEDGYMEIVFSGYIWHLNTA